MYFDQKIKYLDYLENGIRVRGAGFIRLECWGKTCSLIIQASGLFENAKGSFPVMLVLPEKEERLSELPLQNGKGRLELRNLNSEDLKELERIRIPLGESKQLVAVLRDESDKAGGTLQSGLGVSQPRRSDISNSREDVRQETSEGMRQEVSEGIRQEAREGLQREAREGMRQEVRGDKSQQEMEGFSTDGRFLHTYGDQVKGGNEVNTKEVNTREVNTKEANTKETNTKEANTKEANTKEANTKEVRGMKEQPWQAMEADDAARRSAAGGEGTSYASQANLRPGKWEQLLAIYPQVAPFGDSRQYLQISPGDFVILKDRSYRMVNNSFLLHGYFTYHHLILHRQNRRGEMVYYVGVPGRYYDREKEVAILFGFESFEGTQEPAREGDFGYYMMRVEL